MKVILKSAAMALLAGVVALIGCGGESAGLEQRPNVVLIVVDTLRADVIEDLAGIVDTPRIDELAQEGVPFGRAYAHAPMTLPSHTALFSSRLPVESGVLNNRQSVPDDLPLLTEWMSQHGYSTRAVISLGTLTPPKGNEGLRRGFEKYDTNFFNLDKAEYVLPRLKASLESWPAFNGEDDRPFFLFAHYCDPHEPYRSYEKSEDRAVVRLDGQELGRYALQDAPNLDLDLELEPGEHRLEITSEGELPMLVKALRVNSNAGGRLEFEFEEGELFKRTKLVSGNFTVTEAGEHSLRLWMHDGIDRQETKRRYVAEVEHVDGFVGDLLDLLRASGKYDNTFVLLVSDHGESLGERGSVGHVQHLNDPMIRVPLIIKPSSSGDLLARLAKRGGEPVSLMDLTPTILSACGLPPLPGQRGESLLFSKRRRPFEHIAETHKPEAKQDRVSLFDGVLRMVYVADLERFFLYDLSQDPLEERDVFEERGSERPEWPQRLIVIAEQAAAITAGDEGAGSEREATLRALGYAE